MTGTPIQNNLMELWALLHFCMPSIFGTLDQFLSTFKEDGRPSSGDPGHEVKDQFRTLKYILGAFMLRRMKAKLIERGTLVLPPLTKITVMAPLVSLQKKVYISILRKELPKLLAFASGASGHQSLHNIKEEAKRRGQLTRIFLKRLEEKFRGFDARKKIVYRGTVIHSYC